MARLGRSFPAHALTGRRLPGRFFSSSFFEAQSLWDGQSLYEYSVPYYAGNFNPSAGFTCYGTKYLAQTFTPQVSHVFGSATLYLNVGGSPTGSLIVGLYATSAGQPTGSALDSATIAASSVSTLHAVAYTLTFTGGVIVSAGTTYAIVIGGVTGDASDYILWINSSTQLLGNNNSAYSNGTPYQSTNSGSTWTALSHPFFFLEYGTTPLFTKQPELPLSETYSLTESFIKSIGKALSETFSLVEAFTAAKSTIINFDNSLAFSSGTTSYTCTGSNLLLLLFQIGGSGADSITTGTYNGVSMTKLTSIQTSAGRWIDVFYLLGPATGSNSLVTDANCVDAVAVSYTGVKQSGFPDSQSSSTGTGTSIAASTTVIAASCWELMAFVQTTFTSGTAGTGTTKRQTTSDNGCQVYDSNGTVGTGSQTLNASWTGSTAWAQIVISIAPVTGNNYTKSLSEAFTLAETFLKATVLLLTETYTLAETFIKQLSRTLTDSFSISEAFQTLKTKTANLADSLSITELFARVTNVALTDVISVAESFKRTAARILSEILISITETFSAVKGSLAAAFSEAITVVDAGIKRVITRALVETYTVIEFFTLHYNGVLQWFTKRTKGTQTWNTRTRPGNYFWTKRNKP